MVLMRSAVSRVVFELTALGVNSFGDLDAVSFDRCRKRRVLRCDCRYVRQIDRYGLEPVLQFDLEIGVPYRYPERRKS